MSENRITDPDVLLQQELDAMAAEVPDMPASFRNGWREAVREDARMRAEAEAVQDRPNAANRPNVTDFPTAAGRPAGTDRPAAAHPASGRLLRTRRWVPWVCAAAMMVFLVGGTMLTRNTLSPRLRASHTAAPTAVGKKNSKPPAEELFKEELAEEEVPEGEVPEEELAEEAAPDGLALAPASAGSSLLAPVSNHLPRETAPVENPSTEDTGVEDTWQADEKLQLLLSAPDTTGSPTAAMTGETVEAEEGAETEAVPSSRQTIKREAPGLRTRILDFLEDMGAFVLAALPYLAGAAVLAAGIILLRRRK